MIRATLNESVTLQAQLADKRTDLFGQLKIFSGAVAIVTMSLPHLTDGIYGMSWIPTQEGYYTAQYQFFLDGGLTSPAPYSVESEIVDVSSDRTNLLRLLGLLHENAVFDQQIYAGGNLTSGRLRVYDTKANAELAGAGGLLFSYTILAEYTSGMLSKYSVLRES